MGVMIITLGMSGQPVRVNDGSGKIAYVETIQKTFENVRTGTSYTVSIFADSISPLKNHFVLCTKSSKPLDGFTYIFGVNGVGYTMEPNLVLEAGYVFYTELSEQTLALFCSPRFENINITSNTELSSQFVNYGPYFKDFIVAVKGKRF